MEPVREFEFNSRVSLFGMVAVYVIPRIHVFKQNIVDWDERVYLFLSERMTWGGGYAARESFIKQNLSLKVYSADVFFESPLVPGLIKLLAVALDSFELF